MATAEQLADEAKRARKVRQIVDISTNLIAQGNMSRHEAEALVAFARERILMLFPGSEDTYEIVYRQRFRRIIDEFAGHLGERRAVVLPFPSRHQ